MRKIILLMTFLLILLAGCGQETYENGVPEYFVEPEGYTIAEVKCDTNGLFLKSYYGYISVNDYDNFLSGDLENALIILNPYENGKSITLNSKLILSINTGIYKDIRYY